MRVCLLSFKEAFPRGKLTQVFRIVCVIMALRYE